MAQIEVTLVRADTNQEFDVELPDDSNIRELLPALVKELGLPVTGPDGNQVAYELSNKRTGKEYKEDQSLGGAGTKTGDSLLLTSTFVAGAIPTDLTGRKTTVTEYAKRAVFTYGASARKWRYEVREEEFDLVTERERANIDAAIAKQQTRVKRFLGLAG